MAAWLEPLEGGPRCRKWKLRWSHGSRARKVQRTRRFDGTKRAALAALAEFARECDAMPLQSTQLAEFAAAWNGARVGSGALAPSTGAKYAALIGAIAPHLPQAMDETTPQAVQAAYAAARAPKRAGGLGWSGTTLRTCHNALKGVFRAAEAEGLVRKSPMSAVQPPRTDTKERRALAMDDAAALLSRLRVDDCREFAVALIARLGLRRAEACGLLWADVDEGARTLTVRRETTKTDNGARTLPLDDGALAMIVARKKLVMEFLAGFGHEIEDGTALCCGLDGRPLTADVLSQWWQRNRAGFGLDGVTLHELRHTYLTNLAQAGVHPRVMQELAGHASASTTMGIYTHVHGEDLAAAQDALAAARGT